jgi:PAS domain S-box-containing protein
MADTSDAERIQLALDSGAIVGTFVWDIPADRFTADERFARTFGLDPELCRAGVKLGDVTTVIHPQDWPRTERLIAETVKLGGAYTTEYRVRQHDGVYRWVAASGRCYHDDSGQPVRFPGILVDIEDRRRAEDRLRESEAAAREATRLLRAVIEAVPALIYVKDRDGRLLIANGAVMDVAGKPRAAVEGHTDAEFLDDQAQAARVMQADRRVMESGEAVELEEIVGHDADGPRTWLSHKTVFHNEQGEVVGLVGTSVDITARKRTEKTIAASEARLRRILDNLFAFVGICDLEGTLVEANRAPVDGAGVPREAVIGHPFWQTYWFSHDEGVAARIADSVVRARQGETVRFDVPIRWHDDTRLLIDFQMAPLRDEAGDIVQLVPSGVDITAREEARQGLQVALDQRQLLIRELNHRVKNLFAVICGMVTASARSARNPLDMSERLRGRIMALSHAHELIQPAMAAEISEQNAGLADLVAMVLAPHTAVEAGRLHVHGPPVEVTPNAATALALTLHELATNAAKYGALSTSEGLLDIAWAHQGENLVLTWSETGGPPVTGTPKRFGFGSQLARLSATGQLGGAITFDWQPTGVRITLTARRDQVECILPPRLIS